MSSVLTVQIAQALFPWLRSDSTSSNQHPHRRNSDYLDTPLSPPTITIQPAENVPMRPLFKRGSPHEGARHRRSTSASSYQSTATTDSARSSMESNVAPFPHVGLASLITSSRS